MTHRDGPDVAARFWAKVVEDGDCWLWTGARIGAGYGHFAQGGPAKMVLAHRWSYESMVGAIPEGLEIDHLCRVKACVNPWHLEPVTRAVNIERNPLAINKRGATVTTCPSGHAYDEANTRLQGGRRHCRACARGHSAAYRRKAAA